MKKIKLIIPANKLFLTSADNKIVYDYLRSHNINGHNYLYYLSNYGGNYVIKNIVDGKAYNGSTKNLYYRLLSLGWSSSWRSNIARRKSVKWIRLDNLKDFIIIIYPSEDNKEIRHEKEHRIRRLYKLYDSKYGYNICIKSTGGFGTGGHRWVTNGDIDLLLKINDKTPDGFFPGQKRQSWVRNFFERYNWEWRLRTPESEEIKLEFNHRRDLLNCTIAPTLKVGGRYVASLVKNLKELYNITITFKY